MHTNNAHREPKAIEVLLVEDSPTDRLLALSALAQARIINVVNTVENGIDAMHYLRREGVFSHVKRPDLVLLDLNLPKKDGREVLAEMKADPLLRFIPVVVMTSSSDTGDIVHAYDLYANGYISKPVGAQQFTEALGAIGSYWFEVVTLPDVSAIQHLVQSGPTQAMSVPGVHDVVNVLLIEDSPSDALLVCDDIERSAFQFETTVVSRLAEAREHVRVKPCDLILTDLGLSETRGLETYRAVRALAAGLPVIVFTGRDDEHLGMQALREGAQDYLVKGQLGARTVARSIRYALEKAEVQAQLRQSQRLDAVGQLAAGIAHDFNNILAVINGHASLLAQTSAPDAATSAREIERTVDHAAGLTRQLLSFSGKQVRLMAVVDLNQVVGQFAGLLRRVIGSEIRLELQLASELPAVLADNCMMEQVILNLALNARDAMASGGKLTIQTATTTIETNASKHYPDAYHGRFVCMTIRDTGTGMTPAVLARVWEPFFTTKEVGKGTGLGLSTVYAIVRDHGGWAQARSKVGEGAIFEIYIPASKERLTPLSAQREQHAVGGTETVLVVEDNEPLRKLTKAVLEKWGYRVLEAQSAREALALWNAHPELVDLLLTDLTMPDEMTGIALAEEILLSRPLLPVIFVSGYSADIRFKSSNFLLKEGVNFLHKPYAIESLAKLVRVRLDASPRSRSRPTDE
jgi:two-component system, cell cycle sensor histidine kinase and response regulator CckA